MKLRIFLVGLTEVIRQPLKMFIETLGHEVVVAEAPEGCPHYHAEGQICSQDRPCGDALLLGQKLPALKGIEFIERRKAGGCKGIISNNAIICEPWSDEEARRAATVGCEFFETPVSFPHVENWLVAVEKRISLKRELEGS